MSEFMKTGITDKHGWVTSTRLLKLGVGIEVLMFRSGSFYHNYHNNNGPDLYLYDMFKNWLTPTDEERTLFQIETGIHYPEQFMLDLMKEIM